jgi:hypothetical protein
MNDGDLAATSFFTACEDLHVSVNWGAVGYFIVKYLRDTRSVVQGILCHPAELYRDFEQPILGSCDPRSCRALPTWSIRARRKLSSGR